MKTLICLLSSKLKLIFTLFNLRFLSIFAVLFVVFTGFANITTEAQTINDINVLGTSCLFPGQPNCEGQDVFTTLLEFGLTIAPFFATLVILWGGYKYFFGGLGFDDQAEARKTIQAGVIGLIIVLSARVITTLVQGSVGEGGILQTDLLIGQINQISNFFFALAGVVAVAVIIYGGYQYLFSGLPGEQKDGLETIRNGVIGLVVVLLARPLANLIPQILGAEDNSEGGADLTLNSAPLVDTIKTILSEFFIPISSVITVAFFVYGAYLIIAARGNADQFENGKKAILNATIGLVVVLLATTIVQLIIFFVPQVG